MQPQLATAPATAGRVLHSARLYDFMTRAVPFLRALRRTLLEVAAAAPGERVLDVGCGPGTFVLALAPRAGAGTAHGIDASPEMIAVAQRNAEKARADVDFQVALIEALPYPDASMDLVTSSLMLHHLPDDVKAKGLAEIRRVLRPGGRFVAVDFATHSHTGIGHLLSMLGHAHQDGTLEELTPKLRAAGFVDVQSVPTRHRHFAFVRAR